MKYKVLLVLFIIIIFVFGLGITYSVFNSNTNLNSSNQNIAKFVFNTEQLNEIELPIIDLKPGDVKIYDFAVSNNYNGKNSDVSIEYQMTIKTYHLMPLLIELYDMEEDNLILTCDETYTRNTQNEIVCNASIETMSCSETKLVNYQLKITFPTEYDSIKYSNLVDYIDIEINSWQKINME